MSGRAGSNVDGGALMDQLNGGFGHQFFLILVHLLPHVQRQILHRGLVIPDGSAVGAENSLLLIQSNQVPANGCKGRLGLRRQVVHRGRAILIDIFYNLLMAF